MGKYLPIIFICLSMVSINGLLGYFIRKDSKDSSNVIRMPKILIIILFLGEIAWLFIGIMAYIYGPLEIAIMFWLFCFLSFLFGWYLVSSQIKVADDSFEKRDVLFRKKTFYFKDCIMKKTGVVTLVQNEKGIEIYRLTHMYTNATKLYDSYAKFYSKNKKKKSISNEITCTIRLLYFGIVFFLIALFIIVPIVIAILEASIVGIVLSSLLFLFCFAVSMVCFLYFYKWKLILIDENIIVTSPFHKSRTIDLKQNYSVMGHTIEFYNKDTGKIVYKIYTGLLNNFQILEK